MKQAIYILTLLVLGLGGCNNQTTEKTVEKNSLDSIEILSVSKQEQNIYIIDKSQYHQYFINGLANFNESIKLIDNYIIVGTDTTYFPEELKLNERTIFTASKNNNKFILTLIRMNLTNIKYKFQLLGKDKNIIDSNSGIAILVSGFFLAPEGEPDPETGFSFVSNEYGSENDNFWLTIKVGIDKNYKGRRRAKIIYGHKENLKMTEKVDESPILRLE